MNYATVPDIKTALPGPKAAAAIAADKDFISSSYTRGYPFVMARGTGVVAEDIDGNVFLDMTAGIAVNATGHSHPRIVQAISEAASRFTHMSGTDFYYPVQAQLARMISERTRGGPHRVFFCNSGAEANEGAMKLARWYTKRPYLISFRGAFHGRTYGAMSLGCSKAIHRNHYAPLVPSVIHANYPYSYRAAPHLDTPEKVAQDALDYFDNVIFKREVQAEEVAAIFVEPVQGEGGYVVPPANFLPGLRALCDKHGILLVLDEVQSGMGRTGKFWAHEHFGIEADIITSAKGIASGLPLGAVIAKKDIMTWPPGSHASTFGGNPIACAAAVETIKLLDEGLTANAAGVGEYMKMRLDEWAKGSPVAGEVRGMGLMLGVEIVKSKQGKERDAELRNTIELTAFARGLLILGCGENNIRFCPSLVLSKEEADKAVSLFAAAVEDARKQLGRG
ncbi:MAG: acetyl ornithine aminotransferase family protein [Planctomycetes bacterium]|nr:acetyl ornithine aminotransferase family protein [Planctomycetota bacterium]MCW8137067.1 acetyl ornithine aminotransferase family protein [Planctomycetota bacterium]